MSVRSGASGSGTGVCGVGGRDVAAGDAAGAEALDYALVVKLTRVVLLVFVAAGIGIYAARKVQKEGKQGGRLTFRELPIPWFIVGFLAVSAIYTTGIVPESVAARLVDLAYLLLAMAMAGSTNPRPLRAISPTPSPALTPRARSAAARASVRWSMSRQVSLPCSSISMAASG